MRMRLNVSKPVMAAALAGLTYFLFCFYIERASGALDAAFGTFADEPAHYVSGLLIRDYVAQGLPARPVQYSTDYYAHLPYFAVGYWPPVFYAIEGAWFLIFGCGRAQAVILSGVFAAGSALLIFSAVRRWMGAVAGFCAGMLFLAVPEVQRAACAVMLDLPVTFFALCACHFLVRYLEKQRILHSAGFAVSAALAILTKYSGGFVAVIPWLAVPALRRWRVLRSWSFWIQPPMVIALTAPWVFWTIGLATKGLPSTPRGAYLPHLWICVKALGMVIGWPLGIVVLAAIAVLIATGEFWRRDTPVYVALVVALLAFLAATPVGADHRYLVPGVAGLVVVAFAGVQAAAERAERLRAGAGVAARLVPVPLAAALLFTNTLAFNYPPRNTIRPVVEWVVSNPRWASGRILVAPEFEGPMVAEFATYDRHRASLTLVRPGKVLAESGWFGDGYSCKFGSPEEMERFFESKPVDLLIWRDLGAGSHWPHEEVMVEMLRRYPQTWRRAAVIGPWVVYEYCAGARVLMQ